MSEYVERFIRFGKESTWGSYPTSWKHIQYVLSFDATTTDETIEEDLVTASRQARSRVWVQRGVVGSLEINPLSPQLLYYALGRAESDPTSPYTIRISGTMELPSFAIERALRGATGEKYTGYLGCKIDRLELLIEREEDITLSLDFAGKDNTFPTYTWSAIAPTGTWKAFPFAYWEAELLWGNATIPLHRVRIEINNNLEARHASKEMGGDPTLIELREGAQVITGEFLVGEDVETYAKDYARARAEGTITVRFGNDTRGTIEIICNRVALNEFADALRGREPYEVSFPFRARCSGPNAYDAIEVYYYNTLAGTIDDLDI